MTEPNDPAPPAPPRALDAGPQDLVQAAAPSEASALPDAAPADPAAEGSAVPAPNPDRAAEGSAVPAPSPASTSTTSESAGEGARPSFVFFGIVSSLSLLADVLSKAWAQIVLSARTQADPSIVLIKDHLTFTLALNRGGAWGLMSDAKEAIRHPFFFLVSALAIVFIISLYGRLAPGQRALKWGLPLVFGGALGNFSDRLVRSGVIDFIDYRADWIESMNRLIAKVYKGWAITDHWPTFNVADIAICIGVGLMAVDMFTSRRGAAKPVAAAPVSDHA